MGKTSTKTKAGFVQKHKIGTHLVFKGYDGGETGELEVGEVVKVTGFDDSQDLYNVETLDGEKKDSLFEIEFEVSTDGGQEAEAKPAKAGKAKAAKVEEQEEEKPAKAPKAKAEKVEVVPQQGDGEEDEEQEEEVKPAKAAKASKVEHHEDALPAFKQTTSVAESLKEYKGSALDAAKGLAEKKEKTIFTLGGVLAFIKRNDSFTEFLNDDDTPAYPEGIAGFNAYVKEELGIESRSAAYYVDLYEMFSQITTESKIAKIGWTKLRELLPLRKLIDKDNVEEWLAKAKSMTTSELHEEVRSTLVDGGEGGDTRSAKEEQVKLVYVVHNDQANTVAAAIARAKDIMGDGTSDSAALVHILGEWLNLQDSEG